MDKDKFVRIMGALGRAARETHKAMAAEAGLTPEQEQEICDEGAKLVHVYTGSRYFNLPTPRCMASSCFKEATYHFCDECIKTVNF